MSVEPEALRVARQLEQYKWHIIIGDATRAARLLREQHAEIEQLRADAERYRELASRANKVIAYDRYGNGAYWEIRFFADDNCRTLAAAIDAAMREGER